MKKRFFVLITLIFIFYASAFAAETINVSLSTDKVFVGDIFTYKIKAELPENAHISANQNIKPESFEIFDISVRHTSYNPNIYEIELKMAAYKTGLTEIEPLTVFYLNPDGTNNLFFTPQSQITVESVAGDESINDIKDIKMPGKRNIKTIYIVLILLFAAAFILVLVFLIRDAAEKRRKANEIVLTPFEKAINDLNELYISSKDIPVKIFYYRMFEILRIYVYEKYGYDTMEMTTAEFFECAKKLLPPDITVNEFKNYLKIFNLARYAGFKPDDVQAEESYNFTKKLLENI